MPLIPQQHILHVTGTDTGDAVEKLKAAMDELPPVRVVSFNPRVWEFDFLGTTREGMKIIAVVEEA